MVAGHSTAAENGCSTWPIIPTYANLWPPQGGAVCLASALNGSILEIGLAEMLVDGPRRYFDSVHCAIGRSRRWSCHG